MNQTTKKQHYIWRSYLASWTKNDSNEGNIMCLRDHKIFPVSLMNVAHENYFYSIKELSNIEKELITILFINNTEGARRAAHEGWLRLYCAPFDYADWLNTLGYSIWGHTELTEIRNEQDFKNWNIEYIEKLHSFIESQNIQYVSSLKKNDLHFWKDETKRDQFSFFIANQYLRTKNSRDAILNTLKKIKTENPSFREIRPENMWIPISLICASDVGVYIAQNLSAVLLQTGSHFVVGDQPVINTYSTFNAIKPPKDIEFFCPLTPNSALLLTANRDYSDGQIYKISSDVTAEYNLLEYRTAREMIFAKEREHLDVFLK